MIIEVDSERGKALGFTSDRFTEDSYLWDEPGCVWVSLITSRQKGNFCQLVAAILAEGSAVVVPNPLEQMERIVKKNGYVHSVEPTDLGPCDLWTLRPESDAPRGAP
jgi:hypothetical protein